jgi:hypothetical protein
MNGGDGHNQQDREDKVETYVSDPFKRTSTSRVKKSSLIHADYGSQHNRPSFQFLHADLEGEQKHHRHSALNLWTKPTKQGEHRLSLDLSFVKEVS